jgi:tRNA pseudouridine38-40 synthase
VGCGRTDTGVHADKFYAHWDYSEALDDKLLVKLNAILPRSISIEKIFEVNPNVNCRFQAVSRTYHYFLHTQKNPFIRHYSTEFFYRPIDFLLMREAASLFLDYTHFLPVIKLNKDDPKTHCTLMKSEWTQLTDTTYRYEIQANRFLHNMVRRIVGSMLLVGTNRLSINDLRTIMDTQATMKHIYLAAPQGLHLVNIQYPEELGIL